MLAPLMERGLRALDCRAPYGLFRPPGVAGTLIACAVSSADKGVGYVDCEGYVGCVLGIGSFDGLWVPPESSEFSLARGHGSVAPGAFEFCGFWVVRRGAQIIVARDHAGTRPAYFARLQGAWVVSSELRALLAMIDEPCADRMAIAVLLQPAAAFRAPPDRSGILGVSRVPAGHVAVLEHSGRHRLLRHWHPEAIRVDGSIRFEEGVQESRRLLRQAIARRCEGGLDVGAHLSGGLDSSTVAVATLRHQRSRGRVAQWFSWTPAGYAGPATAELARIRAIEVAESWRAHLLDEEVLREELQALEALDPVDYPRMSIEMELSTMRSARNLGVSRLLSGWGGDEVVSLHPAALSLEFLRRGRLGTLAKLLARGASSPRHALQMLKRRFRHECLLPMMSSARGPRTPALNCASAALRAEFPVRWGPDELLDLGPTAQAVQLRYLRAGFLAERMESWWCHGQRHDVDYAYPLLDRDLVEFVLKLPAEHHFRAGVDRAHFKAVASAFLDASVLGGDLKEDSCLHQRLAELKLFAVRDGHGCEYPGELIDQGRLEECRRSLDSGIHKVEYALTLLRRCQWRARHSDLTKER